ncbi:DUF6799 domain-containing protein [Hymenobacter endophyticus]|uniref:DUF6799 domain-containing protein n=1 Tax=Hymenobacter endophyticus TaxID=3076335 RepID=A0ABU3TED8_9BACT|nr:DUF6799 domain-containing protein [Hymenobacter endophyticus]MDU0369746.1 DUF6799 domain-containing protein [Hymenobacter endophyticus]
MLCILRLALFFLTLLLPLAGWAQANDGFQRRDGAMYLLRNGQVRPMPQDVRLPNGRLVTRDGFVVQRDGRRTELRDGQGCTLLGEPTAVSRTPAGQFQLVGAAPPVSARQVVMQSNGSWKSWWRGRGKGHGKRKKHK